MIDRAARDQAAAVIADYLALKIHPRDLEKAYPPKSEDPALRAIGSCLWFHYDDVGPRQAAVPPIKPEARKVLERCLAFLRSDEEYRWPVKSLISFRALLLHPLISGLLLLLALTGTRNSWGDLWSPWDLIAAPVLWILLLRLRNALEVRRTRALRAHGDPEAWPFLSK